MYLTSNFFYYYTSRDMKEETRPRNHKKNHDKGEQIKNLDTTVEKRAGRVNSFTTYPRTNTLQNRTIGVIQEYRRQKNI